MPSGFVVAADPFGDNDLRFGVSLEAMLPNAFELESSHERFGDDVLLRRMRKNEFLMEARGLCECVHERIVRAQHNSGVAHR